MKKFFLFFALVLCGTLSFSQTADEITAAFTSSYTYEYNGDYTKAIEALTALNSSTNYEVNFRLGWLYYSNKDYAKSQTYYKKAIGLQANSVEALYGYIYPTAALENWEELLTTYLKIITIDSKNSVANYRVAQMYYYKLDYTTALTYVKKVIDMYPFDFDANVLAAQIYVSKGEITSAKKHYQIALHYNPTSTEVIEALKKL